MAAPRRSTADNPTLLLLRTTGSNRGGWDSVIDRIPGFAHTVAIDLREHTAPGAGHNTAHGAVQDGAHDADVVRRMADDLARRIAALGLNRPHVVGHSLGATVALELAHRVPLAAVTAFCAIGFSTASHAAMCSVRVRAALRMVRTLGPAVRRRVLSHARFGTLLMSELSARPAAIHSDAVAAYVSAMATGDVVALSRAASRHAFTPSPRTTTPVNLVWADQDRIVPMSGAQRAMRPFPHARHSVILGSGHLVMHDDPEGTAAIIHACHTQLMLESQRADR